jgi:hypothetical protein
MALTGHKRQREGGDDDAASGAGARIDTGADNLPVHELLSMQAGFVEHVPETSSLHFVFVLAKTRVA